MAILRKLYPIFLPLILTGCYEDFMPDVSSDPVLCINSLITAGEPITVSVTHTRFFTDDRSQGNNVDDATVAVYANGELQTYDYIPQEGDRIRIVADSKSYGSAEAEVTVPVSVPVEVVEFRPVAGDIHIGSDPGYDMNDQIKFDLELDLALKDRKDEKNFYRFSYRNFACGEYGGKYWEWTPAGAKECSFNVGKFIYEAEPIFSEHIGIFESVLGGDSDGFTCFTDGQFPGKEYTLHLRYTGGSYSVRSKEFDSDLFDCGITVTVSAVSESYYKWCNYAWQIESGPSGDMSDLGLSDQMWGYSNVSTGAGVVAAMSKTVLRVSFREFLADKLVH